MSKPRIRPNNSKSKTNSSRKAESIIIVEMNDVKRFLNAFQYDNALTLAEILFAENDSEENLVTLAEVVTRYLFF